MDNNSANSSLIDENVVEQPLSPVLNRKRYNRSLFHKSAKKQITEYKSTKSPEKRASSIPIPINVAKTSPKKDAEVVSGKSISTSEAKIREYTDLLFDVHNANVKSELKRDFNVKTVSDARIKHLKRDKKFSVRQPKPLNYNFEYKLASGDESCEVEIKERSQFINGEGAQFNNLNMLYENREFLMTPHCSKTTLTDSVDSGEVHNIHNTSFSQNVVKEFNKSQLNYNVATDESSSTIEHDIKEIYEKSDTKDDYVIGTQETNMIFSNVSQFLHPELDDNFEGLNSSKNMVNVNLTHSTFKTLAEISPLKRGACERLQFERFCGFDKEDLAQAEIKFDKFRTALMMLDSGMNDAMEEILRKIRASELENLIEARERNHFNPNKAVRKKLTNNPDEAFCDVFNSTEAARKKMKNNPDETDGDVFNSIETVQKKMKNNSPDKAVSDCHNPIETIKKKVRKNNPDEADCYAINAIKRKVKNNNLDGQNSINNQVDTNQPNSSKHHRDGSKNHTHPSSPKNHADDSNSHSSKKSQESKDMKNNPDDSNSHSSKKSQESEDMRKVKSMKKKEGKLKKSNTSSEQSDNASLKQTFSKKVRNSTEASSAENAPENQNIISLPSNNRVQICIGNNRIKINIRSEGDKSKNEGAVNSPNKTKIEKTVETVVHCSPKKAVEAVAYSPSKSKDVQNVIENISSKPEKCSHQETSKFNDQISTPGYSQNGGKQGCLPKEKPMNIGFKTASGKPIVISEEHLKNATRMYEGTLSEVNNLDTNNEAKMCKEPPKTSKEAKCAEKTSGVNSKEANVKKFKEAGNNDKQEFEFKMPSRISDYGKAQINLNSGFSTASGTAIKISESVLNSMARMFEETCYYRKQFRDTFQNVKPSNIAQKSHTTPSNCTDQSPDCKNLVPNSSRQNTNDHSNQAKELQTISPLQRKILKPKSLLKSRPESGRPSHLHGGSRKSLHFHDPTKHPSCGDAGMNIIEFGNLQTSGFTLASGKSVEIPKEKLEKAMNLLIGMEEDVSGIINASKGKENIAQNFNEDSGFSSTSGNKEKFVSRGGNDGKFCLPLGAEKKHEAINVFDSGKDKKQTDFEFSLVTGRSVDVSKTKPDEGDFVAPDGKVESWKNSVKVFGAVENDSIESQGFGFTLASGKNVDIPKERLKKAMDFFGGDLNLKDEFSDTKHSGFALASGKNVNISKEKITKAMNVFKDIDRDLEDLENSCGNDENNLKFRKGFTLAANGNANSTNEKLTFENEKQLASGKNLQQTKHDEYEKGLNISFKGFSSASGKNIEIPQDKIDEAMRVFNIDQVTKIHQTNLDRSVPEILQDAVSDYTSAIEKCSSPKMRYTSDTPERKPYSAKKQLGMLGRNKPVNLSKEALERGKQIFKDFDFNLGNSFSSPVKNTSVNAPQCSTPKLKTEGARNVQTLETFNLTPIKTPKLKLEASYKDSTIIFHEKSCGDFKQLQSDIDNEYENLKKKLVVLEERKNELARQKVMIDSSTGDHKRPKIGVLLENKSNSEERVPLKNLFNSGDESVDYFNVPQHIFDITSKNAEDVHFNLASENDCVSIVKTSDGAIIIPSSANTVGVTEINNAFHAMKGVDPKLLPNGWVHNHYKWIVWKLASYERKFPQYFKDCLSLENIIQQLKYRYDVEIDRAKRPALRRIYEKDDVPQKRMVLCISDIVQLYSNKFDLELTDGWYSIKTVIDAPLCQQIYRNKIKIGTKLIIQGAELLNCENGTHPLEASDVVRLKISYNGTRRAHWYTKLGYYKYAAPFPVHMSSLSCEGGPVGFIKIYIARVYPVRYIENLNNAKVWRNGRAEEKRANEFDAERAKKIETIKDKACREYQKEKRETAYKMEDKKITKTELSTIHCPKTLYNLIQCSGDPESLIELLTQSQQKTVMEYKQNLNEQRQHEISMRVSKQIDELKLSSRNVTPVLKLVVMDACENTDKFYIFNVWRPSEEHLQVLKEDASFYVYNVTFGKTGDLHSSNRTYFRQNNEALRLKKPERQLLPIAMTVDNYYKPRFDEFDTVGLIVQITIQEYQQDLWVTDFNGRLLYIKIASGPTICCLLDNLKRGQTVAISNLTKKKVKQDFGISIANQCSIISQYPSQKYLQNGLKMFKDQLPKNLDKLLTDCDAKIEHYKNDVDFVNLSFMRNFSFTMDKSKINDVAEDSMENNSTIPSQLTMIDVAMSLIDIDQFTT